MNKGSSLISEYMTSDLSAVRDIQWTGMDWGATETTFKIYCAPDKLYVVDGAWAPGLFTVEGLDTTSPTVTDHTAAIAGVGGLALDAAATNLYYWYQYGWSAGTLNSYVSRLQTSNLVEVDRTAPNVPSFNRDPLDAPLLLDERRGLVFANNKVFDALNLELCLRAQPLRHCRGHGHPVGGSDVLRRERHVVDALHVAGRTVRSGHRALSSLVVGGRFARFERAARWLQPISMGTRHVFGDRTMRT